MHSSGMRTGRALTVSRGGCLLQVRGVSAFGPGGVTFGPRGGVCFWSGGCLLLVRGVSAFGPGGVYPSM